jgi:hypothetical protein
VRLQEEAHSAPRRATESTRPDANDSFEKQGPLVPHPSLGVASTIESPTLTRSLGNDIDIVDSLKQVVDKIKIVVDEVDETAKACIALHPSTMQHD